MNYRSIDFVIVCVCCRISAQIYNVREDYERLADALEKEIKLATESEK